MQKSLLFSACLLLPLLYPVISHAQKKRVAILGSSTTAGFGASVPDSDYAHIFKRHYQDLLEIDTLYILDLPGASTVSAMPTGFVPSYSSDLPVPDKNVTYALSLNADILLINYPTNDISRGYGVTNYLSNLRAIYKAVTDAGKVCWITTTQPRNMDLVLQHQLVEARDSIYAEFSGFTVDFWDPLVDPSSLNINPIYNTNPNPTYNSDGTHANNAGHQLLALAAINANVLPAGIIPLAVSLTGFTAVLQRKGVLLSWTDMDEDDNTLFELQRSADGASFKTIGQEKGAANGLATNHSWSDNDPLPGRNFYRLKMTEKGAVSYSKVAVINRPSGLAIDHILGPSASSRLIAGINVPSDQTINIRIISGAGVIHRQRSYAINAPLTEVPVDITGLAAGTYVLQVIGRDGAISVKTFVVF